MKVSAIVRRGTAEMSCQRSQLGFHPVEFVRRGTLSGKVSAVTAWNFYPVEFVRRGTAEMKLSAVTAWNFYPIEFVRRGTAEMKCQRSQLGIFIQ
ncbi:hypothetical protein J6590_105335 [Homalodisca vitripennis]|nr:hypothetical protein J6590_105335 [Homalodisca vitripennis]